MATVMVAAIVAAPIRYGDDDCDVVVRDYDAFGEGSDDGDDVGGDVEGDDGRDRGNDWVWQCCGW